ncbi:hypothetical protein JKP88DRAFT_246073 [Tribonema minus]|uniref:Uncharacterized protein n=1 Tax=Tribonema minus TaxID=303371 RepID=A0A836CDJ0_9STRA|nr:hypothetical protein JKP88DRAFT_246073 [Tribonema minus]
MHLGPARQLGAYIPEYGSDDPTPTTSPRPAATGDLTQTRLGVASDAEVQQLEVGTKFWGSSGNSRYQQQQDAEVLAEYLHPCIKPRLLSSQLYNVKVLVRPGSVKWRTRANITVLPPDGDIGTMVIGANGSTYAICSAVLSGNVGRGLHMLLGLDVQLQFGACVCEHCHLHPGAIFGRGDFGEPWQEVPESVYDPTTKMVLVDVKHFGEYALAVDISSSSQHDNMNDNVRGGLWGAYVHDVSRLPQPAPRSTASYKHGSTTVPIPGPSEPCKKYVVNAYTDRLLRFVAEGVGAGPAVINEDHIDAALEPEMGGAVENHAKVGTMQHSHSTFIEHRRVGAVADEWDMAPLERRQSVVEQRAVRFPWPKQKQTVPGHQAYPAITSQGDGGTAAVCVLDYDHSQQGWNVLFQGEVKPNQCVLAHQPKQPHSALPPAELPQWLQQLGYYLPCNAAHVAAPGS